MTTTRVYPARTPSGCGVCGIEERRHGQRWHSSVGRHGYQRPALAQILQRMRERRRARYAADLAAGRAPLGERVLCVGLLALALPVTGFVAWAIKVAAGGWL